MVLILALFFYTTCKRLTTASNLPPHFYLVVCCGCCWFWTIKLYCAGLLSCFYKKDIEFDHIKDSLTKCLSVVAFRFCAVPRAKNSSTDSPFVLSDEVLQGLLKPWKCHFLMMPHRDSHSHGWSLTVPESGSSFCLCLLAHRATVQVRWLTIYPHYYCALYAGTLFQKFFDTEERMKICIAQSRVNAEIHSWLSFTDCTKKMLPNFGFI